MRCVTQKGKCYKAMNIKGLSDKGSYTKYKIWVSVWDILGFVDLITRLKK